LRGVTQGVLWSLPIFIANNQRLNTKSVFKGSPIQVGIYAAVAAFLTYTMIFGFRKSFTVCTFDGMTVGTLSYKTVLVLSQMIGYLMAKFYGIKFISELKRLGRNKIILLLVGIAWMAWLCFALIPAPYNIIFLFINGFPLGMLWGVVFSYVEGRRSTDFIGAALAVSFIFSSGFVKSVGGWLIQLGVTEFWVPFCTGLVFALPLLLFIYLMERIPAPDAEDEAARMNRTPMSAEQRKAFVRSFLPGIIACIFIYGFATIFRDIRDNFSADMWKEMGYLNQPAIFSKTETPITLVILALIGSMVIIKNSFKALMIAHLFIAIGFVVAGLSTYLFTKGLVAPIWWMTLVGLGLYMVYIPFNSVFFERMIAAFRFTGNVGFLIYLADSFGYLGSVSVLLSKEIFKVQLNWVQFFSNSVMILSVVGVAITVYAAWYFNAKKINIKDQ
jgi:MFS family permease